MGHATSKMFYISILIMLLCIFDGCSTLIIINAGGTELNYFMDVFIKMGSGIFLTVKYILTSIGVVIINAYSETKLFKCFSGSHILMILLCIYTILVLYEIVILQLIF